MAKKQPAMKKIKINHDVCVSLIFTVLIGTILDIPLFALTGWPIYITLPLGWLLAFIVGMLLVKIIKRIEVI